MDFDFVKSYLLAYNLVVALGWAWVVLGILSIGDFGATWKWATDAHGRVGFVVAALQALAPLETLHAGLGWVRGSVSNAFMQTFGRNIILFGVVGSTPAVQGRACCGALYLSWAVAECIRYPFYATTQLECCPGWLKWLRYSAFVPLYPLGFAAEVLCLLAALPLLKQAGTLSVSMPNAHNFGFDFHAFMHLYGVFAYTICAPALYRHMLKQRAKQLVATAGNKEKRK